MLFPFMAHRVGGCGRHRGKAVSTLLLHPTALLSPWFFPSYYSLLFKCKKILQRGYCIIYFLFCSIVNPINPEVDQTPGVGEDLWVLPSPPETGSATQPLTLPFAAFNFHVIKNQLKGVLKNEWPGSSLPIHQH